VPLTRPGVMHLVDALGVGGTERVAVNMVNLLPRDRFRVHLCTTRCDGPLDDLVNADVGRLRLARRWMLDTGAIARLRSYVARHQIRILHAHETSLFLATAAALLPPFPKVVWHDHFGRHDIETRRAWLYRPPARLARAVIAVTRSLADWSLTQLGIPADRVWYVPNFVAADSTRVPDLPGTPGGRIVCVANFRRQKDHMTLLRAMVPVLADVPAAHLLLVGADVDPVYAADVRHEAVRLGVDRAVSFLGCRNDVSGILRGSDVGVLSSASEGLPLALIEYGQAALPTVATRVGECSDVLNNGSVGTLVPPGDVEALARGLVHLLRDPSRRSAMGTAFQTHVRHAFGAESGLATVAGIYDGILKTH
jgi:glycosyltransferase involved in cell wall biosynthesis